MWPHPHLTLHGGHQARATAEHTVLAAHLMVKCDNIVAKIGLIRVSKIQRPFGPVLALAGADLAAGVQGGDGLHQRPHRLQLRGPAPASRGAASA